MTIPRANSCTTNLHAKAARRTSISPDLPKSNEITGLLVFSKPIFLGARNGVPDSAGDSESSASACHMSQRICGWICQLAERLVHETMRQVTFRARYIAQRIHDFEQLNSARPSEFQRAQLMTHETYDKSKAAKTHPGGWCQFLNHAFPLNHAWKAEIMPIPVNAASHRLHPALCLRSKSRSARVAPQADSILMPCSKKVWRAWAH